MREELSRIGEVDRVLDGLLEEERLPERRVAVIVAEPDLELVLLVFREDRIDAGSAADRRSPIPAQRREGPGEGEEARVDELLGERALRIRVLAQQFADDAGFAGGVLELEGGQGDGEEPRVFHEVVDRFHLADIGLIIRDGLRIARRPLELRQELRLVLLSKLEIDDRKADGGDHVPYPALTCEVITKLIRD